MDLETAQYWYQRSLSSDVEKFIFLYISFNAWYRTSSGAATERDGLRWVEKYLVMKAIKTEAFHAVIDEIISFTRRFPVESRNNWTGTVRNRQDWNGLISFWYAIRCELFHGFLNLHNHIRATHVHLACRSLGYLMDGVMAENNRVFTHRDQERLNEVTILARESGRISYVKERERLYNKYVHSPSGWSSVTR